MGAVLRTAAVPAASPIQRISGLSWMITMDIRDQIVRARTIILVTNPKEQVSRRKSTATWMNSSESLDHTDDGSQKRIVVGQKSSLDGLQVNVQRDFRVEISNGAAPPSREVVSKIHADHV